MQRKFKLVVTPITDSKANPDEGLAFQEVGAHHINNTA